MIGAVGYVCALACFVLAFFVFVRDLPWRELARDTRGGFKAFSPPILALARLRAMIDALPFVTPASWKQATWFVDPQNVTGLASDSNSGIDATHPVASFNGGVLVKWGTNAPTLAQDTTITWLSSATADADIIVLRPIMQNAVLVLQGQLTAAQQVRAGALAGVIAKNRAAAQLLEADLGAAVPAGTLVKNTTAGKVSFAFVDLLVGGTLYSLSQPLTAAALPVSYGAAPSEVDTWANGDTFVAYEPLHVQIAVLEPTVSSYKVDGGNFPTPVQIYHLVNIESDGTPINGTCFFGSDVSLIESRFDVFYADRSAADDEAQFFWNCDFEAGAVSSATNVSNALMFGGIFRGAIQSAISWSIDLDAIVDCVNPIVPVSIVNATAIPTPATSSQIGSVYIRNSAGAPHGLALSGTWNLAKGPSGVPAVFWGPGALNFIGASRIVYPSAAGAAVAMFLQIAAVPLTLNGQVNVSTYAAGTGTWTGAIVFSPANLDNPASLNGLAINPGGASITNQAEA